MNERQRDLRFLEWLFHTDGQASEAGDQPRTRNEQVGSTAGVVHPMVDTRYSLEDILRLESLAGGDNPGAIPLPESHSGYSMTGNGSDEDSSDEIGSSLNGLQQFDAEIDPTSVKLPSSAVESDRNEENPTPSLTYKEVIENAGRALPHIENGNVKADSRHKKASIIYYDYLHDGSTYSRRVKNASAIPSLADRLSVRQRLIVVEDLSKQTIDTLGTKFKINPEFFEEHLLNSGYSGADYNQPSSKTWNTASLQKSHICMKWFRPVWRTPTYFSHQDIHDLLADKTEHFTRRGTFTTRAATNIFRSEWGLWTDPEKTIRVNRECGWEEKVSIWSGKSSDSDCQIGEIYRNGVSSAVVY